MEPKPHGGGASSKIGVALLPVVRALVKAQPNALLEELCERFTEKTGMQVSISTMLKAVKSLRGYL